MERIKRKGQERPICKYCKIYKCVTKGTYKDGTPKYATICSGCKKRKYRRLDNTSELKCSKCTFIAEHICQLDVDHIDGNKKNNEESNLQILCANCHRLKTHINQDYKK